jgi:hypothetical protein
LLLNHEEFCILREFENQFRFAKSLLSTRIIHEKNISNFHIQNTFEEGMAKNRKTWQRD